MGNVLGTKGFPWLYEVEMTGFGYDKHYIYSLGFPNMGNGWCNGKTAQPSKGKHWAEWDPVVGTAIKGVLTETDQRYRGQGHPQFGSRGGGAGPDDEGRGMLPCGPWSGRWAARSRRSDTAPWQTKLPAPNTESAPLPGPGGFQELDLDVKETTMLEGQLQLQGQCGAG